MIFFDFESFQHCVPLVKESTAWKQVVCQYSMHVVSSDYNLGEHDFENGVGGNITHFEFIGNPDVDGYENPTVKLYETLRCQLESLGIDINGDDYRVIVFNKAFEQTRMNEFIKDNVLCNDQDLKDFVKNFNDNVVDLLDFFTSGGIYGKEFNGRGSLKVVQPTLSLDEDVKAYYKNILKFDLVDSLDYHKEGNLVFNGSICLDLYKSLLIRKHLGLENDGIPTSELLKQALAYCKIDSWGTVIIYDIIKNFYLGKLKLDCKLV